MGELRHLPQSFSPAVVAAIDARLSDIGATERVAIPLAIESGSRAWGFPSPDSDYDCRFIFVRPIGQHLTPWTRRDVIETPLDPVLDVNGWDLAKAIRLLLKGNAVILEWLKSPIVYRGEDWFRTEFLELAERLADRAMIGRHYLHLGQRQRRVYFSDLTAVAQKKIFYAIRPAAALRWMRLHPERVVPPMHFPTLMKACSLPADVEDCIAQLQRRKAISHEMGMEALPPVIAAFIDQEFSLASGIFEARLAQVSESARAAAEAFYRRVVEYFG